MQPIIKYVIKFMNTEWVIMLTEEEKDKLVDHLKEEWSSDVIVLKGSDHEEETHRIDSLGDVWCRTPINLG